ncbi:MAG: hypothetical protein RLZZ293_62 [Pseudomonadota bacterium]|jgi:DnaA family protein
MNTIQQLLDLFDQACDFNSFIASGNEITLANLQDFSSQFTHIYGNHLTGKTHLLKAWVNLAAHRGQSSIYLDANSLNLDTLQYINANLDQHRFIAIDNIEMLDNLLQIELFNLFNQIILHGMNNYLLTSSLMNLNAPNPLRIDLKTRIYSGLVFGLRSFNQEELLNALLIYTKREGITIGNAELNYLLSHYTRNLGQLIQFINQLSNYALTYKKTITIPIIKHNISLKNNYTQ